MTPPPSTTLQWRRALMRDPQLRRMAKLVACALAEFMDSKGYCFPSVKTLAERASVARSTAHIAIKELETKGWLIITTKPKGGYWREEATHNEYQARLPKASEERTRPAIGHVQSSSKTRPKDEQDASGVRSGSSPMNEPNEEEGDEDERKRSVHERIAQGASPADDPMWVVPLVEARVEGD